MHRTTPVLALLSVLGLPLQAQSRDFRWHGVVASGKTIEVAGVNGSIDASGTSGKEVEVTAVKRGRRSDPDEVEIKVIEHADGVTICAVYPPGRNGRENDCAPHGKGRNNTQNNDVQVAWTVRVPAGVRLEARTVNGQVDAEGLTGEVEAYTVNGGIRLETRGWATAHTVNGSIHATLGSADWDGENAFETVNGGITLNLPPGTSAEVDASTVNGSMSTDFPLTIKGRWGPRRMSGTIGKGGRTLSLSTVNGSLELRRSP